MGSRKHNRAELVKEERKSLYFAKLTNNPSSPRKTRLMADLIRNVNIEKALQILQHSPKESAVKLRKLLMSAIANWQTKNEGQRMEDSNLYVKEIFVDGGRQLKRMRPAPQGRGHRISKRSSHITLYVDSRPTSNDNNIVS
jgi:large subunit ribosomal protein L22